MTKILKEGVYDPQIFKAVFMAGAPGSGKTTIAAKLFSGTGLRMLNIDNFWKVYNAKNKKMPYDGPEYDRLRDLYHKQKNLFLYSRLGLIIDGTGRDVGKMRDIKETLEDVGYDTALVFVNTTLEVALHRVKYREAMTGRHVDEDYVIDCWNKTQRALGKLQSLFGIENFYIIDNSKMGSVSLNVAQKSLHKWLHETPTHPMSREWIKQQLQAKKRTDNENNRFS